jgi:hypothetical protein
MSTALLLTTCGTNTAFPPCPPTIPFPAAWLDQYRQTESCLQLTAPPPRIALGPLTTCSGPAAGATCCVAGHGTGAVSAYLYWCPAILIGEGPDCYRYPAHDSVLAIRAANGLCYFDDCSAADTDRCG